MWVFHCTAEAPGNWKLFFVPEVIKLPDAGIMSVSYFFVVLTVKCQHIFICLLLQRNPVAIKDIPMQRIELTRPLLFELKRVSKGYIQFLSFGRVQARLSYWMSKLKCQPHPNAVLFRVIFVFTDEGHSSRSPGSILWSLYPAENYCICDGILPSGEFARYPRK